MPEAQNRISANSRKCPTSRKGKLSPRTKDRISRSGFVGAGMMLGNALTFQKLPPSQLVLSSFFLTGISSCELWSHTGAPACLLLPAPWLTIMDSTLWNCKPQIRCFLLQVALVMVFLQSSRKVTGHPSPLFPLCSLYAKTELRVPCSLLNFHWPHPRTFKDLHRKKQET